MSRIDNQLITRIVRHPESEWMTLGLKIEMMSPDTKPVFAFIKKEALRYQGSVPSKDTIRQFFPNFRFRKAPEGVAFYAELVIKRYAAAVLRELTAELAENLQDDEPNIDSAVSRITLIGSELITGVTRIVDGRFGQNPAERVRLLRDYARGMSADFSLGHPVLDEDLIGGEKGNFFIIAGTPGSGKTWLLLKTLYTLWLEGYDILLFSFELSKSLIERRMDSIVAEVEYGKFRRGLLTHDEKRDFALRSLHNRRRKNFFEIITTENTEPNTKSSIGRMDYVYGKIQSKKPQIVGIDGFYLMTGTGDSDWERIASLTRGFHHVTQATGVMGWGTTQLTKTSDEKNPKMRDLSYSWTFAQDTDGAFLLSAPPDMKANHERALSVGKFREAEDELRYILEFRPGSEIAISRLAVPIENPLME